MESDVEKKANYIKYQNLLERKDLEDNFQSQNEFKRIEQNISNLLDKGIQIPLDINKANIKTKN